MANKRKPKYKPNDTVYTMLPYIDGVCECEVISVETNTNKYCIRVKFNGSYYNCYPEDKLYNSFEEAHDVYQKQYDDTVKELCESINSIEDLIKFPLNHCLCGDEYTEYEAIDVYKIKVKELMDIDLNDED